MHDTDLAILRFFNQTIASSPLDAFFGALTDIMWWIPVYLIIMGLLIWKYQWRGVRFIVTALLVVAFTDSLCSFVLKPLFARMRPCALLPAGGHLVDWIRLPVGMKYDFSFPSNHAANNFAVVAFFSSIFYESKRLRIWYVVAMLIGIGRIYEGVHYPTDIVGGVLVGLTIGFIFSGLLKYVEEKKKWQTGH